MMTEPSPTTVEYIDQCETSYVTGFMSSYSINEYNRIYLCDDGIHQLQFKQNTKGERSCIPAHVYKWHAFNLTGYYFLQNNPNPYFVGDLSASVKFPEDFETYHRTDLVTRINELCLNLPTQKKGLITGSLREYIDTIDLPELITEDVIGYTINGWMMPDMDDIYFPRHNQTRKDAREEIHQMCDLYNISTDISTTTGIELINLLNKKQDELISDNIMVLDSLPRLFTEFYTKTAIDHKDIIISWGLISPFLHALKSHTDVTPFLSLWGPHGVGKSGIMEQLIRILTGKIYSYSAANLDSKSRAPAFLSMFTFPILFDDVQDLNDEFLSDLKKYGTGDTENIKFDKNNQIAMKATLCTALVQTMNNLTDMFKDPAFVNRNILLKIKTTFEENNWKEIAELIPDGLLGYWIYQRTKSMSFKDLINIYKSKSTLCKDIRHGRIDKLLQMGAHFAAEWFGLILDLSEIPKILTETSESGNEDILSNIEEQIMSKWINREDGTRSNKLIQAWVKHPVSSFIYNDIQGYLYINCNLIDLKRSIADSKLSMPKLFDRLKPVWKHTEYGSFTVPKEITKTKSIKGIFIPLSDLERIR